MSNNQKKIVRAVLSLIVSFVMWLVISTYLDPEDNKNIKAVPITYIGTESLDARNLHRISSDVNALSFTVNGRRRDINAVDNKNVRVVVDLSNVTTAGIAKCEYTIEMPDGVEDFVDISNHSTHLINVFVDKVESKTLEVRLVPNITLAEGFAVARGTAVIEPREVAIRGPATILEQIEYAEVALNRSDVDQSIEAPMSYSLKDADGNVVESPDITHSTPEVRVYVPIKKTKEVMLDVEIRDGGGITLADNVDYTITPDVITISGDPAILEGINVLKIDQIDLAKVLTSGVFPFTIPIPNGCENLSGVNTAVVNLEITGANSRVLSVTNIVTTNEELPEGYEIKLITKAMDVTVRGPEDIVGQVNPYNIRVVVDLSGEVLTPGQAIFRASVFVDGYNRVGAIGEYSVAVEIRERTEELP